MGKLNEGVWEERREVLGRLAESGSSAAEFCRREKIPYWKLMEWRRRIREMDAEPSCSGTVEKPAFAELVVQEAKPENGECDLRVQMEIALPGGAVVRVFSGADASLVRYIIEAAKSC